jgi:hypothetical protein
MDKREQVVAKINAFDFHDGEIVAIRHDGENAIMSFKNWQEILYRIMFKGVVGFQSFEFPATPAAIIKTESTFITTCIESIALAAGTPAGYSEYQFTQLDIEGDGYPMSIVFQDIEIEKDIA